MHKLYIFPNCIEVMKCEQSIHFQKKKHFPINQYEGSVNRCILYEYEDGAIFVDVKLKV